MGERFEIVEKLGIVREPGYLYYLNGAEVWRTKMVRAGTRNVAGPDLVATGRFVRERGYEYSLSADGDVIRVPRTQSHRAPPKWAPDVARIEWETNLGSSILSAQRSWLATDTALEQVAVEALRGCRRAVTVLGANLQKIGYPITEFFIPSPPMLLQRMERIEGVPMLKQFWIIIGGIQFVDIERHAHVDFWRQRGVDALFCDGLYVSTCDEDCLDGLEDDELVISPDGYHKDGISGGGPYSVVADDSWTPALEGFSWSGFAVPKSALEPLDFLGYLRTSILECAGFPGLLGDPAFEVLRPQLLAYVPLF